MITKDDKTSGKPDEMKDNPSFQNKTNKFFHAMNSPDDYVPYLQRAIGNRAVHRLFSSGVLQAKLRTDRPGDKYEQEADKAADHISQNRGIEGTHLTLVEPRIQRSPADDTTTSSSPPSAVIETPAPTTAETATEKATSTPGLIVEDSVTELVPGQMKKSEFLSQLRSSVCSTAEDALSGTIWSAMGCPWIDRWFGYYGNRNSQQIERAIQRYAPGTAGLTTARDYIPLITARVRSAISVWATTGEVTGMPEGVSTDIPGGGGGLLSGIARGAGSLISGIGRLMFKGRDGGANGGADPRAVQSQLGSGRPLDSGVKSRIGSAFGQDFSGVRIHTDAKAAQLSNDLNARAFTIGSDIAFGQGEYKPGTLIGDALIAHELAHTVQQGGGSSSSAPMQKGETESNSLEEDADMSAVGAVASLWGGIKGGLSNIAKNAMPRLRSGLRLQRCNWVRKKTCQNKIEEEEFFGEESRKTLKEINHVIKNYCLLDRTIRYSDLLIKRAKRKSSAPSGLKEKALRSLPEQVKYRVKEKIGFLLVFDKDVLNQQELEYWESLLDEF